MALEPEWSVFEDYTRGVLAREDVPGMAVAVARNGKAIYAGGFGFRDRERDLPATPDTVFGVGSVTKSFTAALIMQLEGEGGLSTGDPVQRFLPEFRAGDPDFGPSLTIHHFLTHTTGLPPLPSLLYAMSRSIAMDPSMEKARMEIDFEKHPPIDTPEQLMAFIASQDIEPLGEPGSVYSYSNDCYALLGTIIERVTGLSYAEVLQERIIEPLGLSQTVVDLEQAGASRLATLYARSGRGKARKVKAAPVWWQDPAMVAAGDVKSTVLDLIRYLEIYRRGGTVGRNTIMSRAAVRAMTVPYIEYFRSTGYGYGFRIQSDYHGHSLVEHSGGLKGIAAHVVMVPGTEITAAVLSNLSGAPSGQVALAAVNTVLGLPLSSRRIAPQDFPYSRDYLARFGGTYRPTEGWSPGFTIALEGDRLVARHKDSVHRLCFIGPSSCLSYGPDEAEGTPVRFLERCGKVYGLHLGGRVIPRNS